MFYGDPSKPQEPLGLTHWYSDVSDANVIDGGGTGSDNTSIWLIAWDKNAIHGIYPDGSVGGLHDKFDVFAEYDLGTGTISIQTQHVAEDPETGYYVLMGCRSLATGYYSFSQSYGMKGVLSTIDGVQTITLSDNGKWARGTDSFGLYFLSRRSYSTSDRVGYVTDGWFWKSGAHTLQYITSFVRQ